MAQSHFHQGLFTPPPIPINPWDDISMHFIVALPRSPKGKNAIIVFVDRFSKMTHFIACHKCDDATYIMYLFFQEIMMLHGIPRPLFWIREPRLYCTFREV